METITKLQTPGVADIIQDFVSKNLTYHSNADDKQQFLLLLYCLYEVPDSDLLKSIGEQLNHRPHFHDLNLGRYGSSVALTPKDCLYVGHFLSHFCTKITSPHGFGMTMIDCNLMTKAVNFLSRVCKSVYHPMVG